MLKNPFIALPIACPNCAQLNVVTKLYPRYITVFNPCANVFPTCDQFVVAINPFNKLAIPVPICFAPSWIFSQGILFMASFNFSPIIEPISYQFPFFMASIMLLGILLTWDKSKLGAILPEPLPSPFPELFGLGTLFISSCTPVRLLACSFDAFDAFFALLAILE